MNSGLRKTHLRIWVVVVLIAPVIIAISILGRPSFPWSESSHKKHTVQALPQIVKEVETVHLKMNLRGENNLIEQLEIIVKTPLKSASTTVYYFENKEKGRYIGSIHSKGLYRFPIDKDIQGIILYDPIKKRDIQQIDL